VSDARIMAAPADTVAKQRLELVLKQADARCLTRIVFQKQK